MRWLIHWILNAVALLVVAHIVPGFLLTGEHPFVSALIAALAISFITATLGTFLKIVTFPLTLITLGIFWWIINALMIILAAAIVPGFHIEGFLAAFLGAIVLAFVHMILRWIIGEVEGRRS